MVKFKLKNGRIKMKSVDKSKYPDMLNALESAISKERSKQLPVDIPESIGKVPEEILTLPRNEYFRYASYMRTVLGYVYTKTRHTAKYRNALNLLVRSLNMMLNDDIQVGLGSDNGHTAYGYSRKITHECRLEASEVIGKLYHDAGYGEFIDTILKVYNKASKLISKIEKYSYSVSMIDRYMASKNISLSGFYSFRRIVELQERFNDFKGNDADYPTSKSAHKALKVIRKVVKHVYPAYISDCDTIEYIFTNSIGSSDHIFEYFHRSLDEAHGIIEHIFEYSHHGLDEAREIIEKSTETAIAQAEGKL